MHDVTTKPVKPVKTPKLSLPASKERGQGRYMFDQTVRRIFAEYILMKIGYWTEREEEGPDLRDIEVRDINDLANNPDTFFNAFDGGLAFFRDESEYDDVIAAFENLTARHWV